MNIFLKIAVAARIFSMRAASIYLYILLAGLCAPAANAAVSISVPGPDADGSYTVSWTGMGTYVYVYETANGGAPQLVAWDKMTSVYISGKSEGTYTYRVDNYCAKGPSGPEFCDSSTGTVVVLAAASSSKSSLAPASSSQSSLAPVSSSKSSLASSSRSSSISSIVPSSVPASSKSSVASVAVSSIAPSSSSSSRPASSIAPPPSSSSSPASSVSSAASSAFVCGASVSSGASIGISVPATDPDGNFRVCWNGTYQYAILSWKEGEGNWVQVPSVGLTYVDITGKQPGIYTYRVEATCQNGPSPYGCGAPEATIVVGSVAPVIKPISDISLNEDGTTSVPFSMVFPDSLATSLGFDIASSNTALITKASLIVSGTGLNRSLQIKPVANAYGTSEISLTVKYGTASSTIKFNVNVIAVNDPPVISVIADQLLDENTVSGPIAFTIIDDQPLNTVGVSISLSDSILIPVANVNVSRDSVNQNNHAVVITPAANKAGIATVTLQISDGEFQVARNFKVTVTDLPPKLSIENDNGQGKYTVRWKNALHSTRLFEKRNSGQALAQATGNGPSGSMIYDKKLDGVYTYQLYDCKYTPAEDCTTLVDTKNVTVTLPIPQPPALTASPSINATGEFQVSWGDVEYANSYELFENNTLVANGGNPLFKSKSYAGTTAKSAGEYNYQVKACNLSGCGQFSEIKSVLVTGAANTSSSMHSSSAPAFSQVIQAEDYSTSFGVQQQSTSDVGGGLNVGYIEVGDWMRYDNHPIAVAKYSLYKITYRVSSLSGGGSFSLGEKNGSTQYDVVQVPSTGGWQTWASVERIIALPAGTLNLSIRALGSGFNINWFKVEYQGEAPDGSASSFSSTSSSSPPFSQVIQAEHYATIYGVQTQGTVDEGGGLNVGYIDAGDWMRYDNHPIAVVESSSFKITYRVASLAGGGSFTLYDTDTNAIYDTVQVPSTGGWQTWRSVERNTTLPSGTRRLGIKALTSGFNINWFKLEYQGDASSGTSSSSSSIDLVKTGTDFIQALNNYAPADPSTDVMVEPEYLSALTGVQSVGADGSFNYSLPLSIPVGINGVQPKLQLNYNSNGKNGLVGWGWALNGLSVISRCNANMIRDGYTSGIQANDNYKYCIDGQRLVEVSAGEYRTESESFSRIKKVGDYWEMTSNNGTQSRYGFNLDSKLEDDESQTYAWYLDQQKDVSSNSWSVTYNKLSAGGIQTHYPSSISYTDNPLFSAQKSIIFHYEDREDISVKYVAGVRVKNDKRLARIEMKSGSMTVHSYVLAYQQSGQTYHGKAYSDPAKTSRLAAVKQCFGFSLTNCTAPVEFDWNLQTEANYLLTYIDRPAPVPSSPNAEIKLMLDIKGNGSLEAYAIDDSAEWVEKTRVNGSKYTEKPSYRGIDLNQDGRDDVIKTSQAGIQVFLSNGTTINSVVSSGFNIPPSQLQFTSSARYSYVAMNPSFWDEEAQVRNYGLNYVDINNDGFTDLVRYPQCVRASDVSCTYDNSPGDISVAINSSGLGFSPFTPWYTSWRGAGQENQTINFMDINGDGAIDFLSTAFYSSPVASNFHTYMGMNNGKGSFGGAFTVLGYYSSDMLPGLMGDFNGDGAIDSAPVIKPFNGSFPSGENGAFAVSWGVGKPVNAGSYVVGFSTATPTLMGYKYSKSCGSESIAYHSNIVTYDRCVRSVIDFNNDGLSDMLEWGFRFKRTCLDGASISLSECRNISVEVIDHEGRVYLSLGGNAEAKPNFSKPVIYRNMDTLRQEFGGLVFTEGDAARLRDLKFEDYDNDGAFEDRLKLKNNVKPNRIEAVVETARKIDVAYEQLTSNSIYEIIPSESEQDLDLGYVKQKKLLAKRVGVKELSISNGIGGTNKTEYKYKGAKTHGAGYGELGFAEVEKLETIAGQTPLKTLTRYYQNTNAQYKLAGRVKQQLVYTSNASGESLRLLSDNRNQWKVRIYSDDLDTDIESPHYFSYLYQSSSQSWDLDGTKIADSLTQNHAGTTVSCGELAESPAIIVSSAGSSDDVDYSAEGVLLYSQSATCDQSGSSASVQIKAVENLDLTSKGDARGLVQKSKQYAWIGTAVSSATKSFFDVRTQAFTYNALGQLESKTIEPEAASPNSLKLTTNYLYNGFGSVRQITDTWDDSANDGLEVSTRVTTIDETYTNGIRKLVVTKPLNISETTQFHPVWGTPIKQIDANGIETNTLYDNQGRPERINYADGTSSQIDYRRCSGCSPYHSNAVWYQQIKTTGSSAVRMYYDGFNREIGSRSKGLTGREAYTIQTYDSRGAPFQSTAPFYYGESQKTVATYYDALGRVSSVAHPDGSTESRGYYGLRHTTTNRLNQTQTRYLNAAGWVMKSVDNASTPVDFTYWPWGDLKTTQVNNDPKTLVSVAYDKLGRKTEMTDPNTGKTTYTYNALDLVATQTDAKNQRTCFGYDALGRQTKRVDNAGSSCTGTTQNWVYDTKTKGKGQLGSMSGINTDGSSYSEQYSYNNFGLPESTSTSFDGSSYTTTQHYDSFNRPLGVTYPTGYLAANSYNSYGHLDQVKDSTGATLWAANDADALGNIKQFTLGNGAVTTQTYNANTGRIESIRAVSGSLVIQDQHYQFDALGNLSSREDRKNTITQSFCYDALNRLKAARFNGCSIAANDYNYDPLGNLTTKEGLTGTLGYGTSGGNVAGPHAVTSANGWAYQYDEIGNLKTATKAGEQTKTVNYSPFNTPTSITQGSKFSTLVYGPNQDRIKHSDSNGRVTKYVGGIYEEVTKGGVTQKIHYVGDFALLISQGENTNATYVHEYLHRDHIGSIVAISKGNITTVADVSWQANGAWGERHFNQWNGPLDNLLIPTSTAKGFTDHEHLDAVGLIHMNGRVYDPELGRFMSADPFVQAPYNSQSYNRYSYVFNNPLSFTDPSGYQTCGDPGPGLAPGGFTLPCRGGDAKTYEGIDGYNYGQDWQNQQDRQNQNYQTGYPGSLGGWGVISGSANFLMPVVDACAGDSACIKTGLNELAKGQLAVLGFVGVEGLLLAKLAHGAKNAADAKKAADALKVARGANNPKVAAAAKKGIEMHKNWNYGPGFKKEFKLDSGKRADAVNMEKREVIELKPNNPQAIARGEKQVEAYRKELEDMFGGTWTSKVVTY